MQVISFRRLVPVQLELNPGKPLRNRGLAEGFREGAMKKTMMVLVVALLLPLAGCANMSATEQRVLSGGAIGAGSGAVIGALAGSAAIGAAAGAGAGLLGGFIYDQAQKTR